MVHGRVSLMIAGWVWAAAACGGDGAATRDASTEGHDHVHADAADHTHDGDAGAVHTHDGDAGAVHAHDASVYPGTPDAAPDDAGYAWNLPPGFPLPKVPSDNPMTEPKIELGRRLFYEKRLSGNGTQSCASCHRQELGFSDGRAQGLGSTGELHPRSPMPLANVAYFAELTWVNPLKTELADQALVPLFGEAPIELGALGHEQDLFAAIRQDPYYAAAFLAAFPEDEAPLSETHITKNITLAIAAFERTLLSGNSPFDRYMGGERAALSDSEKRGMALFFSEETECFHCHSGFAFSDAVTYEGYAFGGDVPHHNTGLYDIDGKGGYPLDNQGLYLFTGDPAHMGAFRTPSLRNIGVTAPYMHDGSIASLSEVIEHYAQGGRARSPLTSVLVGGFTLTDAQKADLLAFLNALTDPQFLTDPRFADPWAEE